MLKHNGHMGKANKFKKFDENPKTLQTSTNPDSPTMYGLHHPIFGKTRWGHTSHNTATIFVILPTHFFANAFHLIQVSKENDT